MRDNKYDGKRDNVAFSLTEVFWSDQMLESYRGLPKDAKYLIYSAALPFAAFGMFFTDLSFFLTSIQGLSIPLMGLIVTVMGISTFAD